MTGPSQRSAKFAAVCLICVLAASGNAGGGARTTPQAGHDWHARLSEELPLLGHRNWIAVVDSAYPLQTSAGIETIETNEDQLEVVKAVLNELSRAKHVRPVIFTDAELRVVPETDSAGVTAYREALAKIVGDTEAQSLPHEEIISKLDDAGKTFHILGAENQAHDSVHLGVHPPGMRVLEARRREETPRGNGFTLSLQISHSSLVAGRNR